VLNCDLFLKKTQLVSYHLHEAKAASLLQLHSNYTRIFFFLHSSHRHFKVYTTKLYAFSTYISLPYTAALSAEAFCPEAYEKLPVEHRYLHTILSKFPGFTPISPKFSLIFSVKDKCRFISDNETMKARKVTAVFKQLVNQLEELF